MSLGNHNYMLTACMLMMLTSSVAQQIPKYSSYPAASATVYLDFDGHVVQGTSWNWDSTIHARPSGLSAAAITEIFNRVAEDYRIFNINITTDPAVYAKAPAKKRIRIIVTPTSQWYGVAGGISLVGSFTWGDETPAWVFTDVLQNNSKYIGEACSHEAGHTLGLQHQSTYDNKCGLVKEYAEGKGGGEIGWAPIMGVSYYKNQTTWNVGTSIEGCTVIQNDIDIMSKTASIGLRSDDHGNTMTTATPINFQNISFSSTGMINNAKDVDVFKVMLPGAGRFKVNIIPSNVGIGNAGANLDIKVSLVKSDGDTIGRYNPKTQLSASIDTTLSPGTYYMVVDGVANQNTTEYNSIGFYTISGGFDAVLPVTKLVLKGRADKNIHLINWDFVTDEPINSTIVECSNNGISFKTMATVPSSVTSYKNNPLGKGSMYYRIKMLTGHDNIPYYSNTIVLRYSTASHIELMGNIIQNTVLVNVSGQYAYELFDAMGHSFQQGLLHDGYNNVAIKGGEKGLIFMKAYSSAEQVIFKIIRQ